RWGVADFNTQTENAVLNGTAQPVVFVTNSTILDRPEVTQDRISLRVEGPSGTRGAMNITVPVMNGVVQTTVNGVRVEPQIVSNGTHYFVYLQYGQSVDIIQVTWPLPTVTVRLSEVKIETGRSLTVTGSLTAAGQPLAGKAIRVTVDGQPVETVVTDAQGSYSCSQRFEKAGSYQVKAVFPYYERSFESPPAALTVEVPLFRRPEALAGVAAVIAAVVILVFALSRRGRRAARTPL
ncbi:MAG: Ig-like domain-containing protein, partial [Candidatus Bathyarchaeia archaeon]